MKEKLLKQLPTRIYLELRWWHFKRKQPEYFEFLQKRRITTTQNGYSFKPFDENRAIFIHIPKCAGVSICRSIFGNLAGGHTTMEEYLNVFEPKSISKYFKFTIVRNPWDRLVSAYFFLRRGGFNENNRIFFEKELAGYQDFNTFVKNWVNISNIWKAHHFRPQTHYLFDVRKKISPDFIGFFENLEKDFTFIARKIGCKNPLPKSNKSYHSNYINYYNDETMRIVQNVYSDDIESLGYTFDNKRNYK